MIPIALGSVTALAILFERLWSLRRGSVIPPTLITGVRKLVAQGQHDKALALCQKSPTPIARVIEACLRYRSLRRKDVKDSIEDVGRQEVAQMSRLIEALGIIAAVSPLLGLLGTVTGMIQAFRQVVAASARGAIDPSRLANGIWEALITTAAGLSVAILAYLAYRYLMGRANRLASVMERQVLEILDEVTGVAAADGESSTPNETAVAGDVAEETAQ